MRCKDYHGNTIGGRGSLEEALIFQRRDHACGVLAKWDASSGTLLQVHFALPGWLLRFDEHRFARTRFGFLSHDCGLLALDIHSPDKNHTPPYLPENRRH